MNIPSEVTDRQPVSVTKSEIEYSHLLRPCNNSLPTQDFHRDGIEILVLDSYQIELGPLLSLLAKSLNKSLDGDICAAAAAAVAQWESVRVEVLQILDWDEGAAGVEFGGWWMGECQVGGLDTAYLSGGFSDTLHCGLVRRWRVSWGEILGERLRR